MNKKLANSHQLRRERPQNAWGKEGGVGEQDRPDRAQQLTCERCGNKTDAGAWIGFVYVGAECLTEEDKEYMSDTPSPRDWQADFKVANDAARAYSEKLTEMTFQRDPISANFNKYDQQYRVYSGTVPVTNSMFHADKPEDAALIVRACNAYPHAQRLAEALAEFVRVMEHPKTTVAMPHTVSKARKALAQWNEVQP